jgi:hypothetical protein
MNEFQRVKIIVDVFVSGVIVVIGIILVVIFSRFRTDYNFESIDYSEYKKTAKCGDLVIFSSRGPELRFTMQSSWTHVGTVIKFPKEDQLLLYESNFQHGNQQQLIDKLTGHEKVQGPQLVPLFDKLKSYDGVFAVRRLEGPYDNDTRFYLISPLFYQMDHFKFETDPIFWISRYIYFSHVPIPIPLKQKEANERKRIFCSELSMYCLRQLHKILPYHFAGNHYKKYMPFGWHLSSPLMLHI